MRTPNVWLTQAWATNAMVIAIDDTREATTDRSSNREKARKETPMANKMYSIFSQTGAFVSFRSANANNGDNAMKIRIGKGAINHPATISEPATVKRRKEEILVFFAINNDYNFTLDLFLLKMFQYFINRPRHRFLMYFCHFPGN